MPIIHTSEVDAHATPNEPDISEHRDRTEKLRIVAGLYDEPPSLMTALHQLLSQGFVTENICVSGTHDTVSMAASMFQNNHDCDPQLMGLLIHTEYYDTGEQRPTVVGSQGKLFTQLNDLIQRHRTSTFGAVGGECAQVTARFHSQIEQGRLVLMVETGQPRQLIHASRVLLRHSSNSIHTHEFRPGSKC